MADGRDIAARAALIDFASAAPSPHVSYSTRLPLGEVTVTRGILTPNPGITLGATQLTVAMHRGAPFEMEWRDAESDKLRRKTVEIGDTHINAADRPLFQRWSISPSILVVAVDGDLVRRTLDGAFGNAGTDLPTMIGRKDAVIEQFGKLYEAELANGGVNGRLYADGLTTALIVHLFRNYGQGRQLVHQIAGDLSPTALRRVVEYVEAHLSEEIGLADLAALAGLSTHYFGQAFKASVGMPPHRYLINRRIHRAKELLLAGQRSPAEIAVAVGFSSQSHMTFNFRRLTGATPSRFRREAN
jgi:AraC family transcriptional regulator